MDRAHFFASLFAVVMGVIVAVTGIANLVSRFLN